MQEFNNIRRILSCARKAVDEYKMIEEGDKIAVGISGGKDSITMLCALLNMTRFYPKKYTLHPILVNMGFEGMDFKPLEDFCSMNNLALKTVETSIFNIIFNIRKENNPCSLCSRMRRGILHDACIELGCNKLALGHHFDDAVETFMLNLFHEGRLGSFSPVTYLSRKNITMIRPLIYVSEKDIKYFINHNDLPIIKSTCPADANTERENMKIFLNKLNHEDKGLKHRIFGAIQKSGIDGYGISNSGNVNKLSDEEI